MRHKAITGNDHNDNDNDSDSDQKKKSKNKSNSHYSHLAAVKFKALKSFTITQIMILGAVWGVTQAGKGGGGVTIIINTIITITVTNITIIS